MYLDECRDRFDHIAESFGLGGRRSVRRFIYEYLRSGATLPHDSGGGYLARAGYLTSESQLRSLVEIGAVRAGTYEVVVVPGDHPPGISSDPEADRKAYSLYLLEAARLEWGKAWDYANSLGCGDLGTDPKLKGHVVPKE